MDCTIIICTRNRASKIGDTLRAFQKVKVPQDWQVEMIVVDNGSTDHTAEMVDSASHPAIDIRRIHEPRPGKSRALNAAMAQASGKVLLFTDDDVEPADNWVEEMARPLLEGRCDAIAGRILLADDLRRPWFTNMHALWLAEMRDLDDDSPELIGASMGVHRSVFDLIGGFDEELGPGITGFGEETLLWMQMKEAGRSILPCRETFVIHHPEPSRLLRCSWLAGAIQRGRTTAYVTHHWEHAVVHFPALQKLWMRTKLLLRRLSRGPARPESEGCPAWEMSYLFKIEFLKQFQMEAKRPRNYECHGFRGKLYSGSKASERECSGAP
jgi:glucosyl-dolichyl phosphate glucuronosyltransferase